MDYPRNATFSEYGGGNEDDGEFGSDIGISRRLIYVGGSKERPHLGVLSRGHFRSKGTLR